MRIYTIAVGHSQSDPVVEVQADTLSGAFDQARQQFPGRFLICTKVKSI